MRKNWRGRDELRLKNGTLDGYAYNHVIPGPDFDCALSVVPARYYLHYYDTKLAFPTISVERKLKIIRMDLGSKKKKIAFLSGFGEKYICTFFPCQWHIAVSQACLKNDMVISLS